MPFILVRFLMAVMGESGGFVIEGEHKNICWRYALNMDMKLIPMRTINWTAILPIGDNFTMDVDDAIQLPISWIVIKSRVSL
jgi:hypothetical protein